MVDVREGGVDIKQTRETATDASGEPTGSMAKLENTR
jgi:hypothetical protein